VVPRDRHQLQHRRAETAGQQVRSRPLLQRQLRGRRPLDQHPRPPRLPRGGLRAHIPTGRGEREAQEEDWLEGGEELPGPQVQGPLGAVRGVVHREHRRRGSRLPHAGRGAAGARLLDRHSERAVDTEVGIEPPRRVGRAVRDGEFQGRQAAQDRSRRGGRGGEGGEAGTRGALPRPRRLHQAQRPQLRRVLPRALQAPGAGPGQGGGRRRRDPTAGGVQDGGVLHAKAQEVRQLLPKMLQGEGPGGVRGRHREGGEGEGREEGEEGGPRGGQAGQGPAPRGASSGGRSRAGCKWSSGDARRGR